MSRKKRKISPLTNLRRCGLCGKRKNLTRTECCGNWICDDADEYVAFSYARNSCYRNHDNYTVCSSHHHEDHDGDWEDCKACIESQPTELYVYRGTNEYNFRILKNPPNFEPTLCSQCAQTISLIDGGYMIKGKAYVCENCSDLPSL